MPDKMKASESTAAATERRATQRVRASSLIYVELGNGNGGIVTWISESGLALTAAGVLQGREMGDALPKMQIQLPEIEGTIEANGRIVWKSKSGKEAGVRFVDLGAEDRDRIHRWISAQTRKNSFEQVQPELPKMQLPAAEAPKKRSSRFSFADVASSRVGAEEEARPGDFLGAAENADALPSPSMKSQTFVDASKAVASAFESTAFTDERRAEVSSDRGQPRSLPRRPEEPRQRLPRLSVPERRSHSRRPILLFTQVVLRDDNGGLAFNLGEGGLALTAAAALRDSHFTQMRVRFPDTEDWIETKGRLAWISDSGKEAGIEFIGLAENVRARIREWASLGDPADDSQREESEVRGRQNLPSDLPSFAESESPVSVPRESPASSFERRLNTPVLPRSALFLSGMKGVFARGSVRRRVAKIKPPKPARPLRHAMPRQGWVGRTALAAAALILLGLGWTLLQRNYLNEASGLIAKNFPKAAIPSETKEKTLVAPRAPTADPPIRRNEDITPPADTIEPLAENSGSGIDSAVNQSVQDQHDDGLQKAPAVNSPPRSADRVERKTPPPRELRSEPTRSVAPAPIRPRDNRTTENKFAENRPVENKPLQVAVVLPTPKKEINTAPPSLSATPIQPEASTFGKEKEAPPPAPKQPEVPVARTPVVTVSFDPYPSIRMPEKENSKKSRQGKSLQMGHLVLRVDPVYPEEAKQQGVEGTVKLHVVLGRDGVVQSLTPLSGPPLLVPVATNAVRQWRYSPTILGGQAMETEEDVTVLFRLSNVASKN